MSTPALRIAVVGAGAAGLCTAKVLLQAGHDVAVFDRTPDVGGVWSRTRRYPGVQTQSPRDTYAFSDFPMPRAYPEWPSGEQVQAYFESYAEHFGVLPVCRLDTSVESARPNATGGWTVTSRGLDAGAARTEDFDRLVAANGVFCEPSVPEFVGQDAFEAAGGRVSAVTDFHDAEDARGRHALVIGYGKSACDAAVALSDVTASTTVIARQMLWKVPRKIGGVVNFKYLLLTRLGEALFRFAYLRGAEKFLHGVGNPLRRNMVNSLGSAFSRQYKIEQLGLMPAGTMENIIQGAIGLVTEGFYDRVADGRIEVRRDRTISHLLEVDGVPSAQLSDGTVLPAELVIAATGFTQGVPFLPDDVQDRLFDDRANFLLYRQVLPVDVPGLYFAGYNSSFFSPLNAEMAALWVAAHLAGELALPPAQDLRTAVTERLAFMDVSANGHHCRGTKIIPFSMHNVDELLGDLDVNIPARTRALQWLAPVDPRSFAPLTPQILERARATTTTPTDEPVRLVARPTSA